jgi:hypothetical protein
MNIAITSLYLPSGSKIGVGYQVHGILDATISVNMTFSMPMVTIGFYGAKNALAMFTPSMDHV